MMIILRLFLGLVICGGGYLIALSYGEYAKWQEYVNLGDFSGAEAYEVGLWLTAVPGFCAIMGGAFALGWSFRHRNGER